ncbi:HlyD family efflux transporter periplasmic adaptor subunit [Simiduia sp. 21SJ11W-1]|uniref:efflux RND transporter periplasmic adaptor subunit n=1 Tax=Simiduia sp. 21SJ11W-1 TaxID=2909669 RepID=UPI00209EA84D|nr:HlyD family efflux transporter periplasmic adaptor subunit [Simiduia sp. 21SJ11W-1]UTA48448.1 HlyD family efflux transporter periplasmic adaptor subunit [Simiduia sp. 21SJ11W-1]
MENSQAIPLRATKASSGAAMDRVVVTPQRRWLKILMMAAGGLAVAVLIGLAIGAGQNRAYTIDGDRLQLAQVHSGIFEDFIPVRARVTPLNTVFLDAIEGGRIERVLVEDGALLAAGDPIVELSNTSLQLEVTRNEAAVTEQLNNMRSIELQLEQNRLSHKRNLVEINYQITRLTRLVSRQRKLSESQSISLSQLQDTEDELAYYQARRQVTLESQQTDARMQDAQLAFLRSAAVRLEQNLEFSRANLDALKVRAPVAGKLSGFSAEVGQSIDRGGRLGQIDDPDNYKLMAGIDEFYLGRVDIGQRASFDMAGNSYQVEVAKIYPHVSNGQFQVDLLFPGQEPAGIRRGQTLQLKLMLGDAEPATLIPNGAFYQDTGGQWVFVVTDDGQGAMRRNVRLGRRNARFIEVIEGLEVGEQIVTSPYSSFIDMDRLVLSH